MRQVVEPKASSEIAAPPDSLSLLNQDHDLLNLNGCCLLTIHASFEFRESTETYDPTQREIYLDNLRTILRLMSTVDTIAVRSQRAMRSLGMIANLSKSALVPGVDYTFLTWQRRLEMMRIFHENPDKLWSALERQNPLGGAARPDRGSDLLFLLISRFLGTHAASTSLFSPRLMEVYISICNHLARGQNALFVAVPRQQSSSEKLVVLGVCRNGVQAGDELVDSPHLSLALITRGAADGIGRKLISPAKVSVGMGKHRVAKPDWREGLPKETVILPSSP